MSKVKKFLKDNNIKLARALGKKGVEEGYEHPKLELLKTVVEEQVKKNKYSKILIFKVINIRQFIHAMMWKNIIRIFLDQFSRVCF